MSVAILNPHQSARFWRGIASTNAKRALILCAMFGGLVALSFYRAPVISAVFSPPTSKSDSANGSGSGTRQGSIAKPGSAEADAKFFETRIGQLLFSPYEGDYCRLVLFDNQNGAFYEAGHIHCGQTGISEMHGFGTDRILKVTNAFRR